MAFPGRPDKVPLAYLGPQSPPAPPGRGSLPAGLPLPLRPRCLLLSRAAGSAFSLGGRWEALVIVENWSGLFVP